MDYFAEQADSQQASSPNSARLLIVSNRLPITVSKKTSNGLDIKMSSGGLVSGLKEVHQQSDALWIGHCGLFENETGYSKIQNQLQSMKLVSVPLRKKTYQSYYNGISNNAIWPLFHYFPSSMKFTIEDWEAYCHVNKAFAATILELAGPHDRVWVHDYQLMLLPKLLKDARPNLQVSYFHHIPFPSSEVFRILPNREEVLEGLLGADYIGFHTYDYVRHFVSAVSRVLGHEIHVDEIHVSNRRIKVAAHPLGIDFHNAEQASLRSESSGLLEKLRPRVPYLFLGIDRLDYTKGIPERLMGYRQFLRQYPEFVGKVSFIQLCVPSRADIQTYGTLRATVERIVGQINGEFAKPGYTPIEYLYRSLPMDEVYALYRAADVAVVTPLRDGLNLVCKEYVAARTDNDGVLVLSEFAGAASEMGEAVKVNPFDVQELANVMHKALTMPPSERQRRMQLLRERVRSNDNLSWGNDFLDAWATRQKSQETKSSALVGNTRTALLDKIANARKIFIFLDNDGTLTPIASRPELAVPSDKTLNLLDSFRKQDQAVLTIVSGRPRNYCEQYFGNLPVNLVAEHGAFVRDMNSQEWHGQIGIEEFEDRKPDLLKLLSMYTRFLPGSHIEQKETCVVWHYRQAEPNFAESQAKELFQALQSMLSNTSLSVIAGKKTVEIRQVLANKGYAVEHFLQTLDYREGEDVFMSIGDDTTDEDMHRVHSSSNDSIHIGKPNIFAKFFLNSPAELHEFLRAIRERIR